MRRSWRWTIAVFAVALLTRLLWISVPINTDEGHWIRRGPAFVRAVMLGKPAVTYQIHHPGVTNMWIIGSAVAARFLLREVMPATDLARQTAPELQRQFANLPDYLAAVTTVPTMPLDLFVQARILSALVTAACMAGFYALSRRLFGPAIAAIATVILLFEPFFLAYQRFLTTDANQTNFTWLALLAFLIYLQIARDGNPRALFWSLLSGVCFGLAALSKVSAALTLPAFGLAAVWWLWTSKTRAIRLRLLQGLLLWALAAAAVVFLLWPALLADPLDTIQRMSDGIDLEVTGHAQFFLGQSTANPGLLYYPVVLLYRLSPVLLLGSLLGLISLASPALRRHLREPVGLTVILANLLVVLIALTSTNSKLDRYIIPLVPGLALLTGSGIAAALAWADEVHTRDGLRLAPRVVALLGASRRRPGMLLIGILALQLAILLPHIPYYVTYFNPLVGGPLLAQKVLLVGNGELMDQVGAWLRRQTPSGDARVATWHSASLEPYYDGPTIGLHLNSKDPPETWRPANYVVLYVNNLQRNRPSEPVEYFGSQRPLFEVKAHGVDYARVYPGPSVDDAGLAKVANRTNLDFEDSARLVGYDLETLEVPSGQTVVLALYWQAPQVLPPHDLLVHVGIRDADGILWGGHDSVPAGGLLPVDQWEPGQILRDVQQVTVPPGTPPGEYNLEVSFWSPTLQRALEIRNSDAALGNRATLTKFRVTQPAKPPALFAEFRDLGGEDLQIAHRLENEVRIAPDAARLVGYQSSQPAAAQAGDAFPLVLLWQAGTRQSTEMPLRLRLTQTGQTWQRAAGHPLGGNYPPANWAPGQLVRDPWNALLPADAPAGHYRLELVAQTPDGYTVLLDLGSIELLTRSHTFDEPTPQFPQAATLSSPAPPGGVAGGNVAGLLGYALPAALQPGQELPLTLYWQALAEAERSYVRFVHLLDADDRIVAQQDSVPGNGQIPLTSWQVGEYVQDDLTITLPADMPAEEYRLAVGMYDPATGQRLTTDNGQGQILLSSKLAVR